MMAVLWFVSVAAALGLGLGLGLFLGAWRAEAEVAREWRDEPTPYPRHDGP